MEVLTTKTTRKNATLVQTKKLLPKLTQKFRNGFLGLKWLHLGGFSTNYALSMGQTTQIGFQPFNCLSQQEISAKQFLPVNLRGAFDMVPAISAQGSHFETFCVLMCSCVNALTC
jgi:hypothetical protein